MLNEFTSRCIRNKYFRWYQAIVERARERERPSVFEWHHPVPKSIVPNSDVVALTPREHFVCHLLLPRFLRNGDRGKMIWALWGMSNYSKYGRQRFGSRLYENLRNEFRTMISVQRKGVPSGIDQRGEKNPMYGRKHSAAARRKMKARKKDIYFGEGNPRWGVPHTDESKAAMSAAKKGRVWVNNMVSARMVSRDELDAYLADDWVRGRLPTVRFR